MAYAVRKKLIGVNPCDQLTEDDRPHTPDEEPQALHEWTDSEMKGLVAAAEELARQPQARYDYSALLRTALATGLRQSELLGLKWCDIDLTEGELHVRRQWTRAGEYAAPKTKASVRRVPPMRRTLSISDTRTSPWGLTQLGRGTEVSSAARRTS